MHWDDKARTSATVERIELLCEGIYRLVIHHGAAGDCQPGQFVNVYPDDGTHLLPRPISICAIDKEHGLLTLVFRIAGEGTKWLAARKEGDALFVMVPLGNGFPLESCYKEGVRALFVGGGIGIPPLLEAARQWQGDGDVVLGYRDTDFLREEFEETGYPIFVASDSGAVGVHGTVMDVIEEEHFSSDVIFACGPKPMLKALQGFANEKEISCYLSMEERMACGVGACLGCVIKTVAKDAHSKVHNRRVCKDGPVFEASEVEL